MRWQSKRRLKRTLMRGRKCEGETDLSGILQLGIGCFLRLSVWGKSLNLFFKTVPISFIKLVKFPQEKWTLDSGMRAERVDTVFSFQYKGKTTMSRVRKAIGREQRPGRNYVSFKWLYIYIYIYHKRWLRFTSWSCMTWLDILGNTLIWFPAKT